MSDIIGQKMALLNAGGFSLEIIKDKYNVNVSVKGDSYSGVFSLYCTKEDFVKFVKEISELYETLLEGKTVIREIYEMNFLSFESDGMGHFIISGEYDEWGWHLRFSESCDQSYFKNFIKQLNGEVK